MGKTHTIPFISAILLTRFLFLIFFYLFSYWSPSKLPNTTTTTGAESHGMKNMFLLTAKNAEVMLLSDPVLTAKEVVETNGPETLRLWVFLVLLNTLLYFYSCLHGYTCLFGSIKCKRQTDQINWFSASGWVFRFHWRWWLSDWLTLFLSSFSYLVLHLDSPSLLSWTHI